MEPVIYRARVPCPRFGALPDDRIYYDPDHPDILVLYRALHIRDSGAILNQVELGNLEQVSPPGDPSVASPPSLRLSYGGARAR